jgi:DNA-binding MarR family transcriptional regulator
MTVANATIYSYRRILGTLGQSGPHSPRHEQGHRLSIGDRSVDDLGILITLSRRLVWMAATRKLEASGFSMISWALAGHLTKFGPATQVDIAAAIGQHPAGVSRLIDEMEAKKLVRRRRDEVDRRRARIEVTPSGRAMVKAAHPLVLSSLKEALSPLSLEEQQQLQSLLRKLLSMDPNADCVQAAESIVRSVREANAARAEKRRPRIPSGDRPEKSARAANGGHRTNGARAVNGTRAANVARPESRPRAPAKVQRKTAS